MMKNFAKAQASFFMFKKRLNENIGAFSTVETVLLVIAALFVIAAVFVFYIEKVKGSTDSMAQQMEDAPENMMNQFNGALQDAWEGNGSESTTH